MIGNDVPVLRRRNAVEQGRTGGKDPLSIDVMGDRKSFWATTGTVEAGATARVYLTFNRLVGGDAVFQKMPVSVVVWQDADDTPGGLPRAAGPVGADGNMSLKTPTSAVVEVRYLGANRVWAVDVTNSDTAAHNFLVTVEGF